MTRSAEAHRIAAHASRQARARLDGRDAAALDLLGELAALDSPTGDPDLLAGFGRQLGALLAPLGSLTASDCGGAPHLVLDVARGERPLLLLCHYDTVWPPGTAARRPFTVTDGWARGPGVLDMKGGIVVALEAIRALVACELVPASGLRLSLTPDEERGNPASRPRVEELARASCAALVLEPPLADGRLKNRRKGIAHALVAIEGEAEHAGVAVAGGVSAALEAAHVALAAAGIAEALAVSVNVGVLAAGERRNVVAASGVVEIDIRSHDAEALAVALARLRALQPANPRARLVVDGQVHRPPLEPTAQTAALLDVARAAGAAIRLPVDAGASGGGSEANLAHAVGVPTLDGLGALGHGAHAEDERVLASSLCERAALLAGVIAGAGALFGESANSP